MQDQLAEFAYNGRWTDVLDQLRQQPEFATAASAGKGYTPLHQAAWHGADLSVIGALLALGSDRSLLTKEGQTALDIARSRHPQRNDLHYILTPSVRSLAQLIRKLITETPDLFSAYDGNRLICDRLITCLGETWDQKVEPMTCEGKRALPLDVDARVEAAFQAITGLSLHFEGTAQLVPAEHFHFSASACFVRHKLLPPLRALASRAAQIPLEPHWVVLADLFEPAPSKWGLRGSLFLWLELRQALCHCEFNSPSNQDLSTTVQDRLVAAFATMTGTPLGDRRDVYVRRYARGGMSSGGISYEYWHKTTIPLLVQRAVWLQQSWALHQASLSRTHAG